MTEPLIFYHFKGKDDLFTSILTPVFERLFEKLDALGQDSSRPFETIERIIAIHFEILDEMPQETAVAIRACPADLWGRSWKRSPKLKNTAHVCAEYVRGWRGRLKSLLTQCLKNGVKTGDFREMPVPKTVNILIAFINGLARQQVYKLDNLNGVKEAAVSFCRFSLVNS